LYSYYCFLSHIETIDRVNIYGLMFFMFVWHICIYTPIAHITWNNYGFFKTNHIEDFSGGLVVHMTAGITAAVAHLFLNWIKVAPAPEKTGPTEPENLVFSAAMVWFLWFGINAGKAYAANEVATQSVVNSIAGVTTSILVNYFIDGLFGYAVTDVGIVNAVLLGLVSTTPSSGYVTVGGSMVISVITVLAVRVLSRLVFKETSETYSIATMHGVGGSVAFLFTALVSYQNVNPGTKAYLQALNGQTFGMATPIRHHTAAVLAMWVCLFCTLLLALAVCNLIVPLSKDRQSAKGKYAPTPLGPFGGSNQLEQPAMEVEQPVETETA
jgi:Amt family ammonium transporter